MSIFLCRQLQRGTTPGAVYNYLLPPKKQSRSEISFYQQPLKSPPFDWNRGLLSILGLHGTLTVFPESALLTSTQEAPGEQATSDRDIATMAQARICNSFFFIPHSFNSLVNVSPTILPCPPVHHR